MLHSLNWPSLQLRRRISRLQTFYKATYKLSALSIPSYFLPAQRLTRHYHPLHYIVPCSRTSSYQQSYYPRTIRDWNELPHYIIESNNLQSFTITIIVIMHNYVTNLCIVLYCNWGVDHPLGLSVSFCLPSINNNKKTDFTVDLTCMVGLAPIMSRAIISGKYT